MEDEWYLNGAFLLSRGAMPYRDFPLPHLPLLEALLAAIFAVAPIAIRTAEVVTAVAALAGSVLVLRIGDRLAGRAAGTAASLLFATSGLLFRYHVFEREVFDVVPALLAVWVTIHPSGRRDVPGKQSPAWLSAPASRAAVIGILLAIAMAIKLTAFAAFAAVVLYLAVERRRLEAWVVAATAIGAIAAVSLTFVAAFGTDFVVQVFVFRLVHASFPSLGVKLNEMRYTLDLAFAIGLAGLVFIAWTGRTRAWLAVVLQLGSGFLFLVLLNATYWAHTGIELLPWLALAGGALVAAVAGRLPVLDAAGARRASAGRSRVRSEKVSRRSGEPRNRMPALICAGGAVLLVLFVSPVRNLNWEAGDGSTYGFGYRDRSEVARLASFVREHTAADGRVATPPLIAFAANRRELVPYAELAGDIGELTDAVRRDGYVAAISGSPLRTRTFWEGVEASRERIAPQVDTAVAARRVGAVINYSADDLFPVPLIDVAQEKLEASGYELGLITSHYEVWCRK